ncbi:MAG TPA: sugar ABC transporter permease, partial [Trueperaceae bacterium]|nr:sugar ABC transporter permease [Trueperaceae bacterium]
MTATSSAAAVDTPLEGALSRVRRSNPIGYLFTLPYLIFFGVFVAYPVGFAIYLTFHNWNIVRPERPFVGFANFERLLFRDELFWKALYNTGVFLVVHIPLQIIVALALAVILNQQLVARGLFRVSFFLPYVTSGAIISLVWLRLYADDG